MLSRNESVVIPFSDVELDGVTESREAYWNCYLFVYSSDIAIVCQCRSLTVAHYRCSLIAKVS